MLDEARVIPGCMSARMSLTLKGRVLKTPRVFLTLASCLSLASQCLRLRCSRGFMQDTHRPLSSSFWGLPYRILNTIHKRNYLGAYG